MFPAVSVPLLDGNSGGVVDDVVMLNVSLPLPGFPPSWTVTLKLQPIAVLPNVALFPLTERVVTGQFSSPPVVWLR